MSMCLNCSWKIFNVAWAVKHAALSYWNHISLVSRSFNLFIVYLSYYFSICHNLLFFVKYVWLQFIFFIVFFTHIKTVVEKKSANKTTTDVLNNVHIEIVISWNAEIIANSISAIEFFQLSLFYNSSQN